MVSVAALAWHAQREEERTLSRLRTVTFRVCLIATSQTQRCSLPFFVQQSALLRGRDGTNSVRSCAFVINVKHLKNLRIVVLFPALGHSVESLRLPAVVLIGIDRLRLRCSLLCAVCAVCGCRPSALAAVSCAPHCCGCCATWSTSCGHYLQKTRSQP